MYGRKPGAIFIALGWQADRADSDNYWGSFEHAGRVFDLCAYWTRGTLAVLVYECFKQGIDGYYQTDTSTERHLPELAIQKLETGSRCR